MKSGRVLLWSVSLVVGSVSPDASNAQSLGEAVQRSSSARGFSPEYSEVAFGQAGAVVGGNAPTSSAEMAARAPEGQVAVEAGTQLQGKTRINAAASRMNSVTAGQGNAAANEVGGMGGK